MQDCAECQSRQPQAIKNLRKTGYFIYGNHTHIMDAFISQVCITRPKRTFIIADPDAVSIPGVRNLVMMLGCLPLPSTNGTTKKYLEAIQYHIGKKHAIVVFPEAHIWPFATFIRPFSSSSFRYPAKLNTPVVPIVATFEKRKIFKRCLKPRMVITVGEPIFPKQHADLKTSMQDLAIRPTTSWSNMLPDPIMSNIFAMSKATAKSPKTEQSRRLSLTMATYF
jgi:1-acyl-sn-glycerol-3-phosphate acyltransferase